MNKSVLSLILNESINPQKAPNLKDRQEKQMAALRLKRARQNLSQSPDPISKEPIKENPILKSNYELLYKYIASNGDPKRRAQAQRLLTSVYANGLFDNTPLSQIHLKSFLGAGSFSAAFDDDDNHVIKCGGVRDGQSEQDFYNSFLEKPSKEFVVHYYKTFPTPSDPSKSLYLAITNKLLTFTEYSQFIQNGSPDGKPVSIEAWPDKYFSLFGANKTTKGKLWKIREHMIKRKIELTPKNILATWGTYEPEQITHEIGDVKKELNQYYGISYKDSTKILEQAILMFCSQTRPDVHLNNLGVNITSGMNNPSFFFFDR